MQTMLAAKRASLASVDKAEVRMHAGGQTHMHDTYLQSRDLHPEMFDAQSGVWRRAEPSTSVPAPTTLQLRVLSFNLRKEQA